MKIFKSFYKSNKSICLVLLGMSIVALPACEKSRLKVRPAVATSPKTQLNTQRPAIQQQDDYRYDDHYESAPPVVEERTPISERRRDRTRDRVIERESRVKTPSEQRPVSLDGIPVTTVNNHDSKKETVTSAPANGADLNCQSKGCTPAPKPDNGDLPDTDIPDVPKKDKITVADPIVDEEPAPDIIAENTRVTILDKSKSFDHFHLLLVVDRGAIHKNRLGKQVDNDAVEVQRNQVLSVLENFLTGFNNLRPQMIDSSADKEYSFTLGLVAGSNDPKYIGKYFNDTQKEFNTKDISGVQALVTAQMNTLAQDQLDPDKTHPITVNSNFVSLQKFIENNPASINGKPFLSENIPTVVLTIGSIFNDRCEVDSTVYEKDKECDDRHSYSEILKTLIKKKVYGSNTPGIFAPVTFKHIYLDGRNNTIMTHNKANRNERVSYDAESHGVRFATKSLVKQVIDKPQIDFEEIALLVNKRYDENCLVDKDNKYITTTTIGISTAEALIFDQKVSDLPKDKMCKIVETSEFNKAIVDKLHQEELELLED